MKTFHLTCAVALFCGTCQAQVGTQKWRFGSRDEVTAALKKTRGNLRATYEVLICAARQGYSKSSIGFYEEVVEGRMFDASAQDSAAYAFAYDLSSTFRPWGWKRDNNMSLIKSSTRAKATHFRERAFKLRPHVAEVLIMRAFYERVLDTQNRANAYRHALEGVKRAPRWADAHYWLASAASSHANAYATRILDKEIKPNSPEGAKARAREVQLGREMLRAYDQAEKLDSGLHSYLLWSRINAYRHIADKKSAQMIPLLAEQHLRAYPNFGDWYQRSTKRSVEDFRRDHQNLAQRIAREAKS